jgi:hypothetical protein
MPMAGDRPTTMRYAVSVRSVVPVANLNIFECEPRRNVPAFARGSVQTQSNYAPTEIVLVDPFVSSAGACCQTFQGAPR